MAAHDDLLAGLSADELAGLLLVTPYIDGRQTSQIIAKRARGVLCRLPLGILRSLATCRRKIELWPVSGMRTEDGRGASGVAEIIGRRAYIATNPRDWPRTLLHEAGHLVDCLMGSYAVSLSPAWDSLWTRERRAGRVTSHANADTDASEFLAVSFADFWLDTTSRSELSPAVRSFLSNWQAWF